MSTNDCDELISAALDGERVDLHELSAVVATAAGRDTLAAFLMLRAAVASEDAEPDEQPRPSAAVVQPPRPRRWSLSGARVPLGIAASILVLSVAGSFWLGTLSRRSTVMEESTRPAAAVQAGTARETTAASPDPRPRGTSDRIGPETSVAPGKGPQGGARDSRPDEPPTPTRLLRFEPGVDWHSGS